MSLRALGSPPRLVPTHLRLFPSISRLTKQHKAESARWVRGRRQRCRAEERVSDEPTFQQKKQLEEVVQTRIEQAAKMLDDIIDDIVCDMSAVQSIGYIYNEVPTETEGDIIRNVVRKYMDQLDQNFLASLEPFQQKAKRMKQPEVARLIGQIRSEVMKQTNARFPPEVSLLEDLMKISDKTERIEKIKLVAEDPATESNAQPENQTYVIDPSDDAEFDMNIDENVPIDEMDVKAELKRLKILKGETDLRSLKEELDKETAEPPVIEEQPSDLDDVLESIDDLLDDCSPDQEGEIQNAYGKKITPLQLELVANQFITDIEEKEQVANRQLLAKLCIIREEARLVHMERQFAGLTDEESPIKMRENVPSQVMGIIQILLKTNDSLKRVGLIRKAFEKDEYRPATQDLTRAPGYVRPGIFMTALTMTQIEADQRSKLQSTASSISSQFLQRIDDIRLEAMLVLREIAWGEFDSEELAQRQKEKEERQQRSKKEHSQKTDNV